jgi:hypothetical protein
MKLINIIHENFKATNMPLSRNSDGGFSFIPEVFSLKSDKLDKIRELPFCDEFKQVELKIVHSPMIEAGVIKTEKIDKNTILDFGPGIVYLYQINTIDFKTFDLRLYYQPTIQLTHYRGYDLSNLNEEQKDNIIRMINDSSLGFSMPTYDVESRILNFKRENAAKKVFESTNKKPFPPETIKEDMAEIANKELTAENFNEVMSARTKTSFPDIFETYVEIPVSTHGQSITFDSLGNPILNHSDGKKEYFGANQNFNWNATQDVIINKIKNMENNKKWTYQEFLNTPNSTLLTKSDFDEQYELIQKWMNSDKEISYSDWIRQTLLKDFKIEPKENGLSYTSIAKEMAVLERTIDDCDVLDEEQILALKEKIKNFETKLKDKVKPKTITISSVVHNKIKNYCNTFGLKIGDWVEETLLNALDCKKTLTHEEWIEESKEELIKRWRESKKINKLIKTDFLILKPKFKFKGFSILDHKPMYDYLGTDKELQSDIESIRCKIYLTTDKRELDNLTYLNEFADIPVEGFDVNIPEEEVDLEKLTSDGIKKLINILAGKK